MRKICFVIQRYGAEVVGGSESYCRQIAERLTKHYDVEVLTTKAKSYEFWRDEIDADVEDVNGVTVRRFTVEKDRCGGFNEGDLPSECTVESGIQALEDQGPYCPTLIDYVKAHKDDYDCFILMTYLYYPTVMASFEVGDKAVIIPTAHDEWVIYQPVFKRLFENVKSWYFLTPEEKVLTTNLFDAEGKILGTGHGGVGVDVPEHIDEAAFKKEHGLEDTPYFVYAGRVNPMKGCVTMFRYFQEYKRRTGSNAKLVIMGSLDFPIPEDEDILFLGFVSDEEKFSAMKGAVALLQPSPNESLSMVVLESMTVGTPVLVSSRCEVLKGHCLRSNAGLAFKTYPQFEECMDVMLHDEEAYDAMCANSVKYVDENYQWDVILSGLCDIIDQTAGHSE